MELPRIIILEGCDKTGKSTLAKKLSEERGYQVIHFGVPSGNCYYKSLIEILDRCKFGRIVFDRFHWGDRAYVGITTNKVFLSNSEFQDIESRLSKEGAEVVYCHDSIRNIKRRMAEDGEKLIKPEDVKVILSRYKDLISNTRLPVNYHCISGEQFNL
jgi:thymidylate kinase